MSAFAESLIELGWLATILAVPIYFNVDDVRAFEPDKAYLVRDCAAILGVFALLCFVIRLHVAWRSPIRPAATGHSPGLLCRRMGQVLRHLPTLLPMLALAAVVLLATLTSILPWESWYGSYARGQGGLTTLAYLMVGLVILAFLRRPQQAERLGTAIALSGVAPAGYGWVQHFGRDPLPWQQVDLAARVPGTMGNPIFLGALLVMSIPLAMYRLLLAFRPRGTRQEVQPFSWRRVPIVAGWGGAVVLELGALFFTKSRGPFAGLLAELPVFAVGLAGAWDLPWLRRLAVALVAGAVAVLLVVNMLGSSVFGPVSESSALRLLQWNPRTSGSSEVRLDIWGPALQLIPRRPLLGCGPDVLMFCYYPVYPTALRHIEAPNAMPDRTHNIFLDAAVETGLVGLAALLAMVVSSGLALGRMVTRLPAANSRLVAVALLAALAGHLVEGFFGIAIVATQLLTWSIAGAATALTVMSRQSAPPTAAPPSWRPRRQLVAGRRMWSPVRAVGYAILAGALAVSCLAAWQVLALGARATTADTIAAHAGDLEQAAVGNSGQAPVPRTVHPDPVLALRQFAAAAALRDRAIAIAPREEEYLLDAGTTYVNWAQAAADEGGAAASQAGQLYTQALADFGAAARLNPYNPDHLRNTGKAYERWAGLGHDPSQPDTWNQTLLQRAADAFARAAQLAPHHPDPLTSWAEVALWQGHPSQAISLANRALALDGSDGDAFRLRAQAELSLNRRQAALSDWRRALLDPLAGHRGETAAQLALAEATWAHQPCPAVSDAHTALAAGSVSVSDTTTMHEIVHVDGPACPKS